MRLIANCVSPVLNRNAKWMAWMVLMGHLLKPPEFYIATYNPSLSLSSGKLCHLHIPRTSDPSATENDTNARRASRPTELKYS